MGGDLARLGFKYQDQYLLSQMLDALAQRTADGVNNPTHFGVESRRSEEATQTPAWDVVIKAAAQTALIEVKSGEIRSNDRIVFWKRLRRELQTEEKGIVPKLVCDPERTAGLAAWTGLQSAARSALALDFNTAPSRVTNSEDLLVEALYFLCADPKGEGRALPHGDARTTLGAFLLEQHTAENLESRVLAGIDLLFANGLTQEIADQLLGWLNRKATQADLGTRFVTLEELTDAAGVRNVCAALQPGVLEGWKQDWLALPKEFFASADAKLGNSGASVSVNDSQPHLVGEMVLLRSESRLLLGKGGGGKSVLAGQLARQLDDPNTETFVVAARTVERDGLQAFFASIRFKKALAIFREKKKHFVLIVDGLDEVEKDWRINWCNCIGRLSQSENISVLVTMRESDLSADKYAQKTFGHWKRCRVEDWPESVVLRLIKAAGCDRLLTSGLKSLLRQPLMLDIFWRTFVESGDSDGLGLIETRHELLSAFWQKRMVASARHHETFTAEREESILRQAAGALGFFIYRSDDRDGMMALLSESVFVREERRPQSVRFRHPLLQDFLLAKWCLGEAQASEVIARWGVILGGTRQQGALRAMLEAIEDRHFGEDHPGLTLTKILGAIISTDGGPDAVARAIGGFDYRLSLDPQKWPVSVQEQLPEDFGSVLIEHAGLSGRFSWAEAISGWDFDSPWAGGLFPETLLTFVEFARRVLVDPSLPEIKRHSAALAAAKLRKATHCPRFAGFFAENEQVHLAQAVVEVIENLPDPQTMDWIEQDLPQFSWKIRARLIQNVWRLLPCGAERVSRLFRDIISLQYSDERWKLGRPLQESVGLDHSAIEWSLGKKEGGVSLIREAPTFFAPLAVQLAEALTKLPGLESQGMTDDIAPFWLRYENLPRRCIKVIQAEVEVAMQSNPESFFANWLPVLKASRLLSLRSILFDSLFILASDNVPAFYQLKELVNTAAYFEWRSFDHWTQRALSLIWLRLEPDAQRRNLAAIDQLIALSGLDKTRGLRFYSVLPSELVPGEYEEQIRELRDSGELTVSHPGARDDDDFVVDIPEVFTESERIKNWPASFAKQDLKTLEEIVGKLHPPTVPQEGRVEALRHVVAAASRLMLAVQSNPEVVRSEDKRWFWERLVFVLCNLEPPNLESGAREEYLTEASEIALSYIEAEDYGNVETQDAESFLATYEPVWFVALKLFDLALWRRTSAPPLEMEQRWEEVIKRAFREGDASIQEAVLRHIHPAHFLRSDRARSFYDDLVWKQHRSASVRKAGLGVAINLGDHRRAEILRQGLCSAAEDGADEYAKLIGSYLGQIVLLPRSSADSPSTRQLVEDVLVSPNNFDLLGLPLFRKQFLIWLARGMAEQAERTWRRPTIDRDYGRWILSIWHHLQHVESTYVKEDDIVFHVIHWMQQEGKKDHDSERERALKSWCEALLPFMTAIYTVGTKPSCFVLAFQMDGGDLNNLLGVDVVLQLARTLVDRVMLLGEQGADLNAPGPDPHDHNNWRNILGYMVSAVEQLSAKALLRHEEDKENSYEILKKMATSPLNIPGASLATHKFSTRSY